MNLRAVQPLELDVADVPVPLAPLWAGKKAYTQLTAETHTIAAGFLNLPLFRFSFIQKTYKTERTWGKGGPGDPGAYQP